MWYVTGMQLSVLRAFSELRFVSGSWIKTLTRPCFLNLNRIYQGSGSQSSSHVWKTKERQTECTRKDEAQAAGQRIRPWFWALVQLCIQNSHLQPGCQYHWLWHVLVIITRMDFNNNSPLLLSVSRPSAAHADYHLFTGQNVQSGILVSQNQ